MATRSLTVDANDVALIVDFWSSALDDVVEFSTDDFVGPTSESGQGPRLLVQRVPEPKSAKNRFHLDLHFDDFDNVAHRLVGLGATRISDDVQEYGPARWIVMADPEGNEFCVCAPWMSD